LTQNCAFPPELEDGRLLAYLDGVADQGTLAHLKGCAYCSERAADLGQLQERLTSRLYRVNCPSSMELGEYHLRMLPAPRMLVVAQHLRECPHCAREVAELQGFVSDLEPTAEGGLLQKARVLVARLLSPGDPAFAPAMALRGESKGPLTFAAEGIVIVLDIQPTTEGRTNILGQVAADSQDQWTGALVELRRGNQLKMSSIIDDLGAFRCEGVMPGQLELRITPNNGSIVVISNFEISV
jgi:hypothetical protein